MSEEMPEGTPANISTGRRSKESDTAETPLDASINSWEASTDLSSKPRMENERKLSPSVIASMSSAMNLEIGNRLDPSDGNGGMSQSSFDGAASSFEAAPASYKKASGGVDSPDGTF